MSSIAKATGATRVLCPLFPASPFMHTCLVSRGCVQGPLFPEFRREPQPRLPHGGGGYLPPHRPLCNDCFLSNKRRAVKFLKPWTNRRATRLTFWVALDRPWLRSPQKWPWVCVLPMLKGDLPFLNLLLGRPGHFSEQRAVSFAPAREDSDICQLSMHARSSAIS